MHVLIVYPQLHRSNFDSESGETASSECANLGPCQVRVRNPFPGRRSPNDTAKSVGFVLIKSIDVLSIRPGKCRCKLRICRWFKPVDAGIAGPPVLGVGFAHALD